MSSIQCRLCLWLRRYLLEPVCGPILFSQDMSCELDHLVMENDHLRAQLRELEATVSMQDAWDCPDSHQQSLECA